MSPATVCLSLRLDGCHLQLRMLFCLQARASERQRGSATVHGPGEYWRVMRQASELAAMGGCPPALGVLQ